MCEMNDIRESEVCRVLSHKFGVRGGGGVCRVLSHKFGVVQAHRTSSNLLKKHAIRENEVYRVFHISLGWFKHIEEVRCA